MRSSDRWGSSTRSEYLLDFFFQKRNGVLEPLQGFLEVGIRRQKQHEAVLPGNRRHQFVPLFKRKQHRACTPPSPSRPAISLILSSWISFHAPINFMSTAASPACIMASPSPSKKIAACAPLTDFTRSFKIRSIKRTSGRYCFLFQPNNQKNTNVTPEPSSAPAITSRGR